MKKEDVKPDDVVPFAKKRRKIATSCPQCGKTMRCTRHTSNILTCEYKCPNCDWEGTSWQSLQIQGYTMFGDEAMPYEKERMRHYNRAKKKDRKSGV